MINYLNQASAPIGEVLIQPEVAQATRAQEQMAQSRGFRNYNEMLLWAQAQKRGREEAAGSAPVQGSRMPQTWDDAWQQLKSVHPKSMFEFITRKMNEATGGGQ